MAKHSSGQPNYSVARGPLVILLVLILLVGGIVAWVNLRSTNSAEHQSENATCSKGDLTLVVTTDPALVGDVQKLVQSYGESKPVVKDFCIKPQITVAGSQEVVDKIKAPKDHGADVLPAVWVPADIGFVDRARTDSKAAIETPKTWLKPTPVGVAVPSARASELAGAQWPQLSELRVATPGGADAALSAVVNGALTGGPGRATARAGLGAPFTSDNLLGQLEQGAISIDGVAATQPMLDMAGTKLKLISPADAPKLTAPIVTFGSGGPVDENIARAAEDFRKYASNNGADGSAASTSILDGPAKDLLPVLSAMQTDPFAAADAKPAAQLKQVAPGRGTGSTLLLVDSSENVDMNALAPGLSPVLPRMAAGEGKRVALWNYSSPQSEGVTSPVRQNVLFSPDSNGVAESTGAIGSLQALGAPWLWRSLIPAYQYAVDNFAPGLPNRLVLVTTAQDVSGDDIRAAVDGLKSAAESAKKDGKPVSLDVVILPKKGDTAQSVAELKEITEATGGSLQTVESTKDVEKAAALAAGL